MIHGPVSLAGVLDAGKVLIDQIGTTAEGLGLRTFRVVNLTSCEDAVDDSTADVARATRTRKSDTAGSGI
jgi:hypothetical protein